MGEAPGAEAAPEAIAFKVFVRFASADACAACAAELHGKKFDGKVVAADFVSEAFLERLEALGSVGCFVG